MDYEIMMNGNVKIGMFAPEFEAESTMGNLNINNYKGKWIVLFSYPGDFTGVRYASLGVVIFTIKKFLIVHFYYSTIRFFLIVS